jgi:molybdate transport system ATP-binding protein
VNPFPLVELNQVDVHLGGRPILHHLTWRLQAGEHWVILGRNGSGKSTFLRLVRGELWPAAGMTGQRTYRLGTQSQFTAVGVKEAFPIVSPELQVRYLSQEWSLPVRTVIQSGVGGGDYAYQTLTPDQRARVTTVTDLMQVRHLASRSIQELSTGELRRVLIARALAGRPRVLVCDEIGDGLDAESRAILLQALDDAAREGTQLLVSTHRGDEIPAVMTHRLVLEKGRLIRQEPIQRGEARADFERTFAAANINPRRSSTSGNPSTTRPNASRRRPPTPRINGAPGGVLIQICDADVYLADKPTLRGINLEIRQGQHWAIVGPNGSGKSTLLKLIAGDVHPALGARVRRFAFTPQNTLWQLRARIGLVSPELQAHYRESITAAEVVASGFFSSIGLLARPSARQREQVRKLLAALQLSHLADQPFPELSYGEGRRLLLARALVKEPDLLLCDEPFDGLDQPARREMASTLEQAAANGATLVVVTHHREDLPRCITHLAHLERGRLTKEQLPSEPPFDLFAQHGRAEEVNQARGGQEQKRTKHK